MTPFYADDWLTILAGDCRTVLTEIPDDSVDCVVTSPPYWGLRDYGTEGQLGLERTPEEYVANMVAVFREVRRVMKPSGTCWLNLGDSYANDGKWGGSTGGKHVKALHGYDSGMINRDKKGFVIPVGLGRGKTQTGLKPKDLVGIPWRVAFALQQPYYTGTIKDEKDRIWLAAMIDAEGCIFIHKRGEGLSNGQGYTRKNATYGSGMEVSNTSLAVIERIQAITGRGSISISEKGTDARRRQTLYRWNLRTNECRDVLREVYPHLVAKKQQARIAIGCPSSGERAEAAHVALKGLHQGTPTDVDFPAPESMYEPGWYLRSDIVWGKPNPMPESVTDRPTKSHEMIFLLTKQPRYYFDADAVEAAFMGNAPTNLGRAGNHPAGRNIRSVWTIATRPYPGAHFAVFPPELPERCIKAGSSEKGVCPECGAPWERVVERSGMLDMSRTQARRAKELADAAGLTPDHIAAIRSVGVTDAGKARVTQDGTGKNTEEVQRLADEAKDALGGYYREFLLDRGQTTGWQPRCSCHLSAADVDGAWALERTRPAVVLDPFGGSGTVGMVANRLSRRAILIDLNPDYLKQQMRRNAQTPLGLEVPA